MEHENSLLYMFSLLHHPATPFLILCSSPAVLCIFAPSLFRANLQNPAVQGIIKGPNKRSQQCWLHTSNTDGLNMLGAFEQRAGASDVSR